MCPAIPGKNCGHSGGRRFHRRGTVDYDGVRQEVALAYLPEAQIGDYVLVHVGAAMTRLDTAEAERILRELHGFGKSLNHPAAWAPASTSIFRFACASVPIALFFGAPVGHRGSMAGGFGSRTRKSAARVCAAEHIFWRGTPTWHFRRTTWRVFWIWCARMFL